MLGGASAEDHLPDIPAGLDPYEANRFRIEELFERDLKARQQREKNRRKHDQRRRKQKRLKM